VKKAAIIFILSLALLLSFTALASAEILFSASAEAGPSDFSVDYKPGYAYSDISKSPTQVTLTGDLNLFLIHIGAEYSTADVGNDATFSTAAIKAGWDLGLPILSFQLYGGYQAYTLTHGNVTALDNSVYWDLFASVGVQASLADISFYATTNIPLYCKFDNGVDKDDSASMDYLKVGVSYAPIPFVDLFVDYRKIEADSKVMKLSSDGYNFGVRLSF
jgi:hypothetical protein